jgi:hypothetical protein
MTKARDLSQVPNASLGFKNRIINGAMMIDQRNAGASVTGTAGQYAFPVDRFKFYNAASSKLSGQQSTDAPSGFKNSIVLTSLAATTPGASDEYQLYHPIEGFNCADLGFGTASAASVTLSFWTKSSLTGTFAGCISNAGARSYVFTYTINAANTWEQKTITISGDTTGTWNTSNSIGISILWDLGSGSNYNASPNAWNNAFDSRTSGSVNLIGTSGATFYITGVQLEKGSTATSFDYRPYGTELALCQRYCQAFRADGSNYSSFGIAVCYSSDAARLPVPLRVPMRAAPSSLLASAGSTFLVERDSGGAWGATGINFTSNSTSTIAQIVFTSSTNSFPTGGAGLQVYSNNTTNAYFIVGAEL